jgi:hypothetical protein
MTVRIPSVQLYCGFFANAGATLIGSITPIRAITESNVILRLIYPPNLAAIALDHLTEPTSERIIRQCGSD